MNCELFNWEQPNTNTSPLKRCTGCRKMFYCSKDCQVEHWRKVHRKHCKYFSGEKSLEGTVVHNKETCSICIMQESAGSDVYKEANPNYICTFNRCNSLLTKNQQKCPVPLAKGPDRNRVERLVDLLQRLLLKIKLTKQPVSQFYPRKIELIKDELCDLRRKLYAELVVCPGNYKNPVDTRKLLLLLTSDLIQVAPGGRFQIWNTFLMVVDMLHWVATIEAEGMIKYQKSLPKGQRQMSLRVKNSSYIMLTDKVLDALEKRLVSHSDLAAIV